MSIRSFFRRQRSDRFMVGTVMLAAISLAFALQVAAAEKSNIILIMADDLGYGDVGCYGNAAVATPSIDQLAREGMRFTDYHSNAPVCSPTRAAMLTGRYQQRTGVLAVYRGELKRSEITIAQRLSEAGYRTGIFGKWHVTGHARTPEEFSTYAAKVPTTWGFDEFVGNMTGMIDGRSHFTETGLHDWWHGNKNFSEDGYSTHLVTRYATEFIRKHSDQPFFVYLPLTDIHFPWMCADDPPYYAEGINNPSSAFPQRKRGGQHHATERLQGVVHQMISEVDRCVGKMRSLVDELGLRKNTLIVFTSDNGGYLDYMGHNKGEISSMGPYRGAKHQVYEGGHRVPMIASLPGRIPQGVVCNETVMSFDLFPTFLDLAGIKPPADGSPNALDGVTLLPLLTQQKLLPQRVLFWNDDDQRWAVRDGRWKVVIPGKKSTGELYDLETDPGEKMNLARQHPDRLHRMKHALVQWLHDTRPNTDIPFPRQGVWKINTAE